MLLHCLGIRHYDNVTEGESAIAELAHALVALLRSTATSTLVSVSCDFRLVCAVRSMPLCIGKEPF